MKVVVADHSGFCFGVEKAIDTAFKELEHKNSKDIYTLGPLIHNQQVTSHLEENGIKVVSDLDAGKDGVVIIRSHGVPKDVYNDASEKKN